MSYELRHAPYTPGSPMTRVRGPSPPPYSRPPPTGRRSPGAARGTVYSRTGNPTRTALEANLAALGGGQVRPGVRQRHGRHQQRAATSSDRATMWCACDDLYGGSYRLFTKLYQKFGVEFTFVDADRPRPTSRRPSRPRHTPPVAGDAVATRCSSCRSRGRRRLRARAGHPDRGRQHLRHPVPAAAAGPGLRHRRALDHQVPGRPLRRHRRRIVVDERHRARRAS